MAENPQPMTLKQRIASLNASHINRIPGDLPPIRPKPPVPLDRPVIIHRQKSVNCPLESTNGSVLDASIGNLPNGRRADNLPPPTITRAGTERPKPAPPPLPKRQSSQPCPVLPPRRPTDQSSRRDSLESTSSVVSTVSGTSLSLSRSKSRESTPGRIKAPGWGDCELPPLPVKQIGPSQRKYSADLPKYHNRVPSAPSRSRLIYRTLCQGKLNQRGLHYLLDCRLEGKQTTQAN